MPTVITSAPNSPAPRCRWGGIAKLAAKWVKPTQKGHPEDQRQQPGKGWAGAGWQHCWGQGRPGHPM